MWKTATRTLIRGEKGYVLIAALVVLVVLGLIAGPLLSYMVGGLKAGHVVEAGATELYAADAGVQDALWRIENLELTDFLSGYDEYDYYGLWPYVLPDAVNDKAVNITIQNVWIPMGIDAPDAATARNTVEQGKVVITGSAFDPGTSEYQIKISYQACGGVPAATTVGIWLPPGFGYTERSGSCSLQGRSFYQPPNIASYKGGCAVVWGFSPPVSLAGFPGFTFRYEMGSESQGQIPGAAVPWIVFTVGPQSFCAWDADVKIYDITSTATTPGTGSQTTVESYSSKNELRQMGSAIAGDYIAIGNSLLTPTGDESYRNRLYKESDASIQRTNPGQYWNYVPPDATIQAAYLYWVGWIDYHYWYRSGGSWRWSSTGIPELNYNNYASNLPQLIANAKVNTVSFGGGGDMQDITADQWRVVEATDDPGQHVRDGTWSYTCVYDATDIVKSLIEDGVSTLTFGHASQDDTSVINVLRPGYPGVPGGTANCNYYSFALYDSGSYTGYPLGFPAMKLPGSGSSYEQRYQYAYCGWSLIIIYSNPQTQIKNQLYLYDITNPSFEFKEAWGPAGIHEPDFDADGTPGGKVSGFLVPDRVDGEDNVAKMTCFVGEGDVGITGDYFKVEGPSGTEAKLWDGINCSGNRNNSPNNVWNSQSVGLQVPGVDIDTFYVRWDSNMLGTGDTWAQIDPYTANDGFTLVYIILSFRSSITTGDILGYLIRR